MQYMRIILDEKQMKALSYQGGYIGYSNNNLKIQVINLLWNFIIFITIFKLNIYLIS